MKWLGRHVLTKDELSACLPSPFAPLKRPSLAARRKAGLCYHPAIRLMGGPMRRCSMSDYSRRDFLKTGLVAGAIASGGTLARGAVRRSATDWVTLGRS